jgi:hypothetical protein
MKSKTLKVGAAWALSAFAAAAAAHYAGCPEKGQAWFQAIENVKPLVEANDRLVTLKELRKLPTWSLQAVAEAAAKMPWQTRRYRNIHDGLMTEFERRRAKAAGPAKEGV